MTARYRPRRQFKFLLYQDIDLERLLTEFITDLKKERKFVTVIKSALRLYGSLKDRDLSYLDECFPWVREAILASAPKSDPTPSTGNLERLITATVQSSVKAAMMELPSLPATTPVAAPLKPSTNTIGQGVSFSLPLVDDDDQDTIVFTKIVKTDDDHQTETQTPMGNMLAGMFDMEKDDRADRLYEERLAAGLIDLRTGRLREGASRSIQLD